VTMRIHRKLQSALCRLGLHKWSDHKGGIQICLRDGCESAKTFGLQGSMRKLQFEKELYEDYQRYTEDEP